MPPKFWLRLLRNYLPAALLICALGVVFYVSESAEDIEDIIRNEHSHVRNAVLAADRDLLSLARDTQYLSNTLPLTTAIDGPIALEEDAAREFVTYLSAKRIYSKLRWIDESGRELIHVDRSRNGVTIIAPESDEQDKSRRYYFAETMKKQKGETYLTPLDLEIENGIIELPHHPVLRAATPVFNRAGQRRGMIIVTYDAQELFRDIENIIDSDIGNWMLLDQDGYWLRSPDKADEFGFMLPHHANLATRHPSVWRKINAAPKGHFTDESGDLWVFADIAPYRAIASTAPQDSAGTGAMTWKMVKHISASEQSARLKSLRDKTLTLVAILLAFSLLVVLRLTRSQLGKESHEAKLQQVASELGQQKFALDQHAIVAITDVNGTITYVNDKFCTITQYRREELIGQNHRMLNSGLHDSEFFRKMLQTIAAGKVWHSEVCNRAKDGSLYWVNSTFVPLVDKSGKPEAYIAISTDISQTKLHEQRLEEAQRLGKIGHWELDLVTGRLNWSSEVFSIFEIDPQQFGASYEAFLSLVHPEDRELVKRSYSDSVANHNSYDIQHRLLFADGRIKWVSERGVTHYAPDGKALLSVGTVQDISAQKEAEEKLRIASIAFETQEAILVTDARARIISVNRSFERLTGYSAAEAIGQNPSILKSGKHDDAYYNHMWKSLHETGIWSGEMWDKRKDGTLYPKWLTITCVRNKANEITHYVAIFMDISERKRAEEEIHRLAFYDTLTQLPNRRLLLDRLGQSVSISHRSGSYGALLFMDLDNFKTLNDTKGHDVGDMLLVEVAQRLTACVRESDTVARLGGDEFVVILQDLGNSEIVAANQAESIAEKVVASLNTPYLLAGHEHHSSVSIGVCLFHERGTTVDELLKRADTAMYQAKSAGRNAVRFFESSMQIAVEARAVLESELRYALSKQELQLYYQLQADSERRIIGAEVLLRWFNTERGFVSPAQFIPLAEESGLILPIGRWVLETACAQLQHWQNNPATSHLQLAVNVSARQFRQADFVAQVEETLRKFAINPSLLKLELTESLVLVDVEDTIKKMQALKKTGVQFSMDDFGTGYSSLSYLKRLPLNQIKIDQSFVRDIVIDKSDAVIVQTIIDMSKNFGLDVIAEGVETEEQLEVLLHSGCMAFQGYLFSKPIPIQEFELVLSRESTHNN